MQRRAVVTGAGGFIGHHLVKYLKSKDFWVRGVDIKHPEFEQTDSDEFILLDLRDFNNCQSACDSINEVYNLAADMGGIGYITSNLASIARNNVLINSNMLEAARISEVDMFFYSSSACIYPTNIQSKADIVALKEEHAIPANPEEGYGWEKLFSEKMCEYYLVDHNLNTKVARFHNVYGPLGAYTGGKEKAPAALCRKIALANNGDAIEIWGDGNQTRSFMYIDDCVEGIFRIASSSASVPLNLGMDDMITVNALVDLITEIANKKVSKKHNLLKPQGVRGRNSDNTKLKKLLGWSPSYPLIKGLRETYKWIEDKTNDELTPTK